MAFSRNRKGKRYIFRDHLRNLGVTGRIIDR
jgi:hypothetical protein